MITFLQRGLDLMHAYSMEQAGACGLTLRGLGHVAALPLCEKLLAAELLLR